MMKQADRCVVEISNAYKCEALQRPLGGGTVSDGDVARATTRTAEQHFGLAPLQIRHGRKIQQRCGASQMYSRRLGRIPNICLPSLCALTRRRRGSQKSANTACAASAGASGAWLHIMPAFDAAASQHGRALKGRRKSKSASHMLPYATPQ
jgi:hypothetical protein